MNSSFKDIKTRNGESKNLFRRFSQSISILPSKEGDLSVPIGDLISQGVDVRVIGASGEASLLCSGKREVVKIDTTTEGRFPKVTGTLRNGDIIDLSDITVLLNVDHTKMFYPVKSESFGKINDIRDTGKLSVDALDNYNDLSLKERFFWLGSRLSYLEGLCRAHKIELDKLATRYKQAKKKLYDNRHLLLIDRVESTQIQISETKNWYNRTLFDMTEENLVLSDFVDNLK